MFKDEANFVLTLELSSSKLTVTISETTEGVLRGTYIARDRTHFELTVSTEDKELYIPFKTEKGLFNRIKKEMARK